MDPSMDKILLFGDSITQYSCNQELGFALAPALQHLYQRKLDVVVRGYSGYNTNQAVQFFHKVLEQEQRVRLAVIFFGSNDCATNEQNVPLDQYKENLEAMATQALKRDIKVIVVGAATHDEISRREMFKNDPGVNPRSSQLQKDYADAACQVALKLGLPSIHLWHAFAKSAGWSAGMPYPSSLEGEGKQDATDITEYLSDGLHFAGPGYRIWYEELVQVIAERYPELQADNLPFVMPLWREFYQ